jgi:uncharacterized protein (UPF0210 family)
MFQLDDALEYLEWVHVDHFDVRTVTLGISLRDCASSSVAETERKVVKKIITTGKNLVSTVREVSDEYGVPIANSRLAVSPLSFLTESLPRGSEVRIAQAVDQAAAELGVNYVGGLTALVQKGCTPSEQRFLRALPEALASTERLCSSLNVGSTKVGINMDVVADLGSLILEMADRTRASQGDACCRFVVFTNAPDDNPFIAGAFHGIGEGGSQISVGVSGPGVVRHAVERHPNVPLDELAEVIKRISFKMSRVAELILAEVSTRLGISRGIVDLSLAPTPARGDSVANVLEAMGLERCGGHGTTAALMLLNEAVKRGGAMGTRHAGGLSGAFIPLSEDMGMVRSAREGYLSLAKLEAMTAVCSVGLDMVAIPGDTPPEVISAIIADEMAIGCINNKTTAVRILPIPGKGVGEEVDYGGLLGLAPILPVTPGSPMQFIRRGGRIPAPLKALSN